MNEEPVYVVLLFHSTDHLDRLSLKGLGNVHPEIFWEVCVALKQGFDVISLPRLLELISCGDAKHGRFLAVTFDDGPKSYALTAVPVLESLRMPSTCFLITDCIGDRALYWRYLYNYCVNAGFGRELAALVSAEYNVAVNEKDVMSFTRRNFNGDKNLQVIKGISRYIITEEEYRDKEGELFLSGDDLRQLNDNSLITFGIHTRSHPVMKGLQDEELRYEISGSVDFCRDNIRGDSLLFSVPFGRLYKDYDERTVLSALDLSIGAIFSAYGGVNEKGQPLYNVRRIPVHEGILESGVENFVRSLCKMEVGPEYLQAEKRLRDAVERRGT